MVAAVSPEVVNEVHPEHLQGLAGIAKKKCAIMLEIQRLEKDKRNTQQGYNYASESAVKDTIRPLMAKNNLALFPSITGYERSEFKTSSGGIAYKTIATFEMRWVDADTGFSHVDPYVMEANDNQDKGFSKVTTLGVKYFLLNSFLVSTGDPEDDPDSGVEGRSRQNQNGNQNQRGSQQRQQNQRGNQQQNRQSNSNGQPPAQQPQQPPGQPPASTTTPETTGWANAESLETLRKSLLGVIDNLTLREMATLAGIEKSDDYAGWNQKYPKGAIAQSAIKAAFDTVQSSMPPAQPKSAPAQQSAPAAAFEWNNETRAQAETFLNNRFGLTIAVAQEMVGKKLDDFGSMYDFVMAMWHAAFNRQTPFFVNQVQYHPGSKGSQGWSTFPEVPLPLKMWGSTEKFKALEGECATETFLTELHTGKPQNLPKGVKVIHKPAGEKAHDKSQQVERLEIDIPF